MRKIVHWKNEDSADEQERANAQLFNDKVARALVYMNDLLESDSRKHLISFTTLSRISGLSNDETIAAFGNGDFNGTEIWPDE